MDSPWEGGNPMGNLSRRHFLAAASSIAAADVLLRVGRATGGEVAIGPTFISTWGFGRRANDTAMTELSKPRKGLLDAIEAGIREIESDADNASVGLGGIPNADGVVQLDACIMDQHHHAGSVAGLEGILHPITVARRVMELTPHVMLVGAGARQFAIAQGCEQSELLTAEQRVAWEQWKTKQDEIATAPVGHDTIALVGRDAEGNLAGGCSTSGWGYKLPGRVGDSPILGSGLYVDNEVGGAGATGTGENVMRFCGSFMVVEAMRNGVHPRDACIQAIERIAAKDTRPKSELHVNFIALRKDGAWGAAGTDQGFECAVTNSAGSQIEDAVYVN